MDLKEFIDAMTLFPPLFKDIALAGVILSLIEISPLKLNPWKWIKSFLLIPSRIEDLENKFNRFKREADDDKAYQWRTIILNRGDALRRGEKLSEERWLDTVRIVDLYENHCKRRAAENDDAFVNGQASVAIAFIKETYKVVYKTHDYLV